MKIFYNTYAGEFDDDMKYLFTSLVNRAFPIEVQSQLDIVIEWNDAGQTAIYFQTDYAPDDGYKPSHHVIYMTMDFIKDCDVSTFLYQTIIDERHELWSSE